MINEKKSANKGNTGNNEDNQRYIEEQVNHLENDQDKVMKELEYINMNIRQP